MRIDNGTTSLENGVIEASASVSRRSGILGLEAVLSSSQRPPFFKTSGHRVDSAFSQQSIPT